ncbi:GNAT family N-acetyltransferase [Cohnella sp. CFH 77786]|uniref:GNAT family N-acetyltransferase n=1 Tax=Cohnella sp. CFH 77786 TaxID=2662265 RepID=UPI001C610CAE|nr:GNAT family N-acetyltransferase [Cohnella sp. CFH 77786]
MQSGPYVNPDNTDYVVNSFFILKKYRRRGLGKEACKELFRKLPGRYAIGQLSNNVPAIQFWKNLYHSFKIDFDERENIEDHQIILYQYFKV